MQTLEKDETQFDFKQQASLPLNLSGRRGYSD